MSDAQMQRIAQKDQILEAALMHTAFDGWSSKALLAAAQDIDVDPTTARRLFPRKGDSLIEWLDGWLDRKMEESVSGTALLELPVRQRIATLIWARFQALGPHRESLRRAALTRGLPHNWMRSGRSVWQTADRIWQLAGFANNATDGFSRYTRRALLVGILASTFFFWLEDMSEGAEETHRFMNRRIDDALKVGGVSQQLKRFVPTRIWLNATASSDS